MYSKTPSKACLHNFIVLVMCISLSFATATQNSFGQEPEDIPTSGTPRDSDFSPTKSGYEAFLKELGISGENQVPEEIFQEDFKVTLRVLNRHLSQTTDLQFNERGGKVFDDELLISVSSCIEEHNDIPGNDAAFVTIRSRDGDVLFNGWMLRLFPGAAVFEHPVYDVMMRQCESTK